MSIDIKHSYADASIVIDRDESVLTLTYNRPLSMNAVTGEMCRDLRRLGDEIGADENVRVVIITGAGDCFTAGGDAALFVEHIDNIRPLLREMLTDINEFILSLRRMDKIVIAKVHGVAAGGGVSLALACDLVAASTGAKFAWGYRDIGTTPDAGGTYFLSRAVGEKKAFELLLHTRIFSAVEAERWGLINWVVPEAELDAFVKDVSLTLSKLPRNVIAQTKHLVNLAKTSTLEQQLAAEANSFVICATHPNFKEGVTAFIGKRRPNFKD